MALKKKIPALNDELDIRLFLYITRKNIIFVAVLLITAFIGAFLYLRYTHPVYESRVVIQVNMEEQTSKILNVNNLYEEGLQKKLVLLSSPVFLKRALSKLPLDISYYIEGNILSFEQFQTAPYKIWANIKDPAIYGVPIRITFDHNLKVTLNYNFKGSGNQEKTINLDEIAFFKEADIKVILSPDLGSNNFTKNLTQNSYYFILNNPENIVPAISSTLSSRILDAAANTIIIKIQERNASKASAILNTIASEFQSYDVEQKQVSANNILQFIDSQLAQLKDSLITSEEKIEKFKKENNIDSSMIRAVPSLIMKVSDLEDDLNNTFLTESGLTDMEKYLSNSKDLDSYRLLAYLSVGQFPDAVLSLLSPLRDLLLQKEQLLYAVTKNSGQIKSIDYQIDIQKKLILQTIQSYKGKLKEQEKKLRDLVNEYKRDIAGNSGQYNVLELIRLQRVYSINEKYYNQLVETKANYSIAKAGYVSQNIILNNSTIPTVPIYPAPKKIYFFSLLIAAFLGFSLIIIKYLLYNEILSVDDVSRYLNVPVLGVIPKYPREVPPNMLIVDKHPKSVFTESLRAIRTNLQFISNEEGPKVVSITSTVSGEGKTFIAINLAEVFSFSGKKVIILDMDLRKPKIHIRFKTENRHGISTILSKLDELEDCIHHDSQIKIDYITSGPIPPNPSELILNQSMNDLIEKLKKNYDYIVLDTPPVGVVTDGLHCLQLSDYPIYVLKANYSKKLFLENIDRLIIHNKIVNLSLLLNAIEPLSKTFDYTKGYGYGYGHGYGYGSGYGYGYDYSYYDEKEAEIKNRTWINWIINRFRRR
jgi:tyrosine-protein kinase Etk/Wzc